MLNAKFESSKFKSREAIVTNFFDLILDVELRTNLSTGWTSTSTRSTGSQEVFQLNHRHEHYHEHCYYLLMMMFSEIM